METGFFTCGSAHPLKTKLAVGKDSAEIHLTCTNSK